MKVKGLGPSIHFLVLVVVLFTAKPTFAQWEGSRSPASVNFRSMPRLQNEKAIVDCLPKLKGTLGAIDISDLNKLKTQIEIYYNLQRPVLNFRELIFQNQSSERWRVEFYYFNDASTGKAIDRYRLKFFKRQMDNTWMETKANFSPDILDKEALLKFAQFERIEKDERWESFLVPGEPKVSFKSLDFVVFDLSVANKTLKGSLSCTKEKTFTVCHCFK